MAEGAPNLHEVFELMMAQIPQTPEAMQKIKDDGDGTVGDAVVANVKAETTVLFAKSFDHHDTKKTGVLDKDEASVYFTHLTTEFEGFLKAALAGPVMKMVHAGIKAETGGDAQLLAVMEENKDEIQGMIDAMLERFKAVVAEIVKNYNANKAKCDEDAFSVMATDGSIKKDDFVGIMTGKDEEKTKALFEAIGVNDETLGPLLGLLPGGGGHIKSFM